MKKLRLILSSLVLMTNTFVNAQVFSSGVVAKPIPNNLSSLYFQLHVSGLPANINDNFGLQSVSIDILHTADKDLEVYLIAPDGTQVPLTTKNGGDGDNYTGTVFRMDSSVSVIRGAAPFTGAFRPQGDLGSVNNWQNPNSTWGLVVVDVVPADLDSGIFNSWSLTFSNKPAKQLYFTSNLPIIDIRTNGQVIADSPKHIVDIGIIDNGPGNRNALTDPKSFNGKIGIEIRGSSSQQFPKKSYSFETLDIYGNKLDTSILGLPREHDWVLHAPYADKSLMRNALAYRLYADMGHYSVRFRYVEVVINRQYQGVYLLVEKIKRDKQRVNIAKLTEQDDIGTALTGGYIFKIDRVNGNGGQGWYSQYKSGPSNAKAVYFQYEYPSQDSILASQKNYIKAYVDSFEATLMSSNYKDFKNGYRKYIDVGSFIDNFIINELSKNTDGYRLSTFLYKNRTNRNGKLTYGPVWDFDIGWLNSENGGNNPAGWQYQASNMDYEIPFWWDRLMKDTSFTNDLYCHYSTFRKQCLSEAYVNKFIDSLAVLLGEAQARNFYQWPILGYKVFYEPSPLPANYQEEVQNIKNWTKNRSTWLDGHISGKCVMRNVSLIDDNFREYKLKVFPNPFMTSLFVRYELFTLTNVNIEIYNSAGAMVKSVNLGERGSGDYRENIDIASLAAGVYVLKVSLGDQIFNEKVIKSN